MPDTTVKSPAQLRADHLIAEVPKGAKVEVTEENPTPNLHLVQVTVTTSIEVVIFTIGERPGRLRTRLTARGWMKGGGKSRLIPARHLAWRLRHLFL